MIELSGEYSRMQETFRSLGFGLILATLLIYFLMAALVQVVRRRRCVILFAVPLGLVGVVTMLYLTGHGHQRAVAAGRDLHGRHRGVEHGADDRLRPEPARVHEGLTPDRGDPQGGVDPRPAGDDDGPGGLLRHGPDGAGPGPGQRGQRAARAGRSSAASWPGWSRRCSSCRRCIRWSCEIRGTMNQARREVDRRGWSPRLGGLERFSTISSLMATAKNTKMLDRSRLDHGSHQHPQLAGSAAGDLRIAVAKAKPFGTRSPPSLMTRQTPSTRP